MLYMKNIVITITPEEKILLGESIESRLEQLSDYPNNKDLKRQIAALEALSIKIENS